MIFEGVLAIQSEMNPQLRETKPKSFFTPSMRDGKRVSIDKIKPYFKLYDEKKAMENYTRSLRGRYPSCRAAYRRLSDVSPATNGRGGLAYDSSRSHPGSA